MARRLGVAKSTAHRLLTTLASRGLIEQSECTGKYRLGLHLFELGHLALTRIDLRRRSTTLLEELRELSGWTVHLSVAQGADTLFLERLPTLRGMQAMDGVPPALAPARDLVGQGDLRLRSRGRAARDAGRLPRRSPPRPSRPRAVPRTSWPVRRQGYATSREELMYRLASVAAPVLDRHGIALAAISITGSSAGTRREPGPSGAPGDDGRPPAVEDHAGARDVAE